MVETTESLSESESWRRFHAAIGYLGLHGKRRQIVEDATMAYAHERLEAERAALRSTSRDSEVREAIEPRWEVWARHIAPLVHDGLIDAPNERQIPDKAFAIARLLDEHLPATLSALTKWLLADRAARESRDSEVREAIEALRWIADDQDAETRAEILRIAAILDRSSEAAPTPYPRSVAVDENGIPSLVTHYPASEAAPVVEPLDVDEAAIDAAILARLDEGAAKGSQLALAVLEGRQPWTPGKAAPRFERWLARAQRLVAERDARLTQTRTLGEAE